MRVDDLVTGRGRHEIVVRWQLAVGSAVRLIDGTAQVSGPAGAFRVAVDATGPVLLAAETGAVAAGFGRTTDAPVLTCWMAAIAAGPGQHGLDSCSWSRERKDAT